jgi:hypothetical protein
LARPPRYWTVAATHWGEEWRAAHHVENMGYDYYLPLTYAFDRAGEVEKRVRLFPGFLFVKLSHGWEALCSGTIAGIRRVLMVPVRDSDILAPAHVRDAEIVGLKAMEDERGVVCLRPRLRHGMPVSVDDESGGCYGGVAGIVQGMPARGRVRVLFSMLGKLVSREFNEDVLKVA